MRDVNLLRVPPKVLDQRKRDVLVSRLRPKDDDIRALDILPHKGKASLVHQLGGRFGHENVMMHGPELSVS